MITIAKPIQYLTFISLMIFNLQTVKAQKSYYLIESDLPGYELNYESDFGWQIGLNLYKDCFRQSWKKIGDTTSHSFFIDYCEFENSFNAFRGTAYARFGFAGASIWGSSINGLIQADGSWVFLTPDAMYFVRGNIGIKLGAPLGYYYKTDLFQEIIDKILYKVENNLKTEVYNAELTAKQNQISEDNYNRIIEYSTKSSDMVGYNLTTEWDSKWVTDSSNFVMGIRKEWTHQNGALIGIDICQFNSDIEAENAAQIRAEDAVTIFSPNDNRDCDHYSLDNQDQLSCILEKWQDQFYLNSQNDEKRFEESNISIVGYKKNIAFHFYQYDTTRIDTGKVKSILNKLANGIENF